MDNSPPLDDQVATPDAVEPEAPDVDISISDVADSEPDEPPDPDWLSAPQAEANIRAQIAAAPPGDDGKPRGWNWYETEGDHIRAIARTHHVTDETMLGIVAALSPQQQWQTKSGSRPNLALAERVVVASAANPDLSIDQIIHRLYNPPEGESRPATTSANFRNGLRIARGEWPGRVLSDVKTGHFYLNMGDPAGSSNHPTIDRWAQRTLLGLAGTNKKSAYHHDNETHWFQAPRGYRWAIQRFRNVAQTVGMSPVALQAACWVGLTEAAGRPWTP